jgi:hypothetical protein
MNPSEVETNSENSVGNKDWRRITRAELYAKVWAEPMIKIAKEIWHLGPWSRENLQAAGGASSTSRLLGKASSRRFQKTPLRFA